MRVMFSAEQIARRVREIGLELARDYQDKRPLFVGVLKGACMFQCDLARATPIDLELDFLSVSSYGRATSRAGNVHLVMDLREDVAGRHVVLCEGVVDSGLSVSFILDLLKRRRPASLKVATLLDKVPCRRFPVPVDYVGWTIGGEFVIGYGMDAAERLRNLPYVGVARGGRIVTDRWRRVRAPTTAATRGPQAAPRGGPSRRAAGGPLPARPPVPHAGVLDARGAARRSWPSACTRAAHGAASASRSPTRASSRRSRTGNISQPADHREHGHRRAQERGPPSRSAAATCRSRRSAPTSSATARRCPTGCGRRTPASRSTCAAPASTGAALFTCAADRAHLRRVALHAAPDAVAAAAAALKFGKIKARRC